MGLHVALHYLKADENAYSARRVVAEVAGERGFIHHAADDVVGVVIDQVFFHEVVPDRRFVGGGPLVLLLRVAQNILRLHIREHGLREQHLFASIHHIVQERYQGFFWQMLVNQCFCEAIRSHVFRLATGGDVFRQSSLAVLLVIFAHIHVKTDENGVLVAKNGRHLEINAGNQCAEIRSLLIREVCKVKGQRWDDLVLEIRHVRILFLSIFVDFLDDRVADESFNGLQHRGVVPGIVRDDIFWIFAVQSFETLGHVFGIHVE